jgi:hypothetical protein
MSEEYRRRDEKEEKNEKDQGGWDEKWRRDPIDAGMWAVLLIWAGIILLGSQIGWFDAWERMPFWAIGFIGAGIIVLLTAALRLVMPAYRRPLLGNVIFGVVLLLVGLGAIIDIQWYVIGPLILIAIGAGLLLRGVFRRRE